MTYLGFGQPSVEFRGFSAPLWVNTSPLTFLVMSLWGLTIFLVLILTFIFYIDGLTSVCDVSFKPLIIFQLIIVAVNSMLSKPLQNIHLSTD